MRAVSEALGNSARTLLAAAPPPPQNSTAAQPLGGPAGPGWDVVFCLLPVSFLLVVTLSRRLFLPTSRRWVHPQAPAAALCLATARCMDCCPLAHLAASHSCLCSLPWAAAMMWFIKMTWIGEDPIHITGGCWRDGPPGCRVAKNRAVQSCPWTPCACLHVLPCPALPPRAQPQSCKARSWP